MNVTEQERELLMRLLCEPGVLAQNEKPIAQAVVDKLIVAALGSEPPTALPRPTAPELDDVLVALALLGNALGELKGLTPDELKTVRVRRAGELVKAARQLEAKLQGRQRIVWRSQHQQPEPPERTSYRCDDGVWHPAPSMSAYAEHCKTCDACATENLFTADQWEAWKQNLIAQLGATQGLEAYKQARHERAETARTQARRERAEIARADRGYRGQGAVDCGGKEVDCKSARCATHGSPFADGDGS